MSRSVNANLEGDPGAVGGAYRRAGRLPLVERKRAQRTAARHLVRARTRSALTAEQRAVDPLAHGRRGFWTRLAELLSALSMAAAIHVGVVAGTAFIAGREPARQRKIEQAIRVEVREPPPPPPPRIEKTTSRPPRAETARQADRPAADPEGAAAIPDRATPTASGAGGGPEPGIDDRGGQRPGVRGRRYARRADRRSSRVTSRCRGARSGRSGGTEESVRDAASR